ncbi:MAG: formylglycine-generating enzyme family protein, partial [Bradymonadaceae bacterium]
MSVDKWFSPLVRGLLLGAILVVSGLFLGGCAFDPGAAPVFHCQIDDDCIQSLQCVQGRCSEPEPSGSLDAGGTPGSSDAAPGRTDADSGPGVPADVGPIDPDDDAAALDVTPGPDTDFPSPDVQVEDEADADSPDPDTSTPDICEVNPQACECRHGEGCETGHAGVCNAGELVCAGGELECRPLVDPAGRYCDLPDGMVFVPAGKFIMGATNADHYADPDEKPQHTVDLSPYYIDRTEVSRRDYLNCSMNGSCSGLGWSCPYQRASGDDG